MASEIVFMMLIFTKMNISIINTLFANNKEADYWLHVQCKYLGNFRSEYGKNCIVGLLRNNFFYTFSPAEGSSDNQIWSNIDPPEFRPTEILPSTHGWMCYKKTLPVDSFLKLSNHQTQLEPKTAQYTPALWDHCSYIHQQMCIHGEEADIFLLKIKSNFIFPQ